MQSRLPLQESILDKTKGGEPDDKPASLSPPLTVPQPILEGRSKAKLDFSEDRELWDGYIRLRAGKKLVDAKFRAEGTPHEIMEQVLSLKYFHPDYLKDKSKEAGIDDDRNKGQENGQETSQNG